MQKLKRIFALIGAALLVILYICTLIFALIGSSWSDIMLKASIGATILVPVLLYGMSLMARVLKKENDEADHSPDIK